MTAAFAHLDDAVSEAATSAPTPLAAQRQGAAAGAKEVRPKRGVWAPLAGLKAAQVQRDSKPAKSMADLYNEAVAKQQQQKPGIDHSGHAGELAATDVWLKDIQDKAWDAVVFSRKFGPHPGGSGGRSALASLEAFLASGNAADWGFLAGVLVLLGLMDVGILQQLPETARTHVLLLTFWLLVAMAYGVEVWCRLGPEGGMAWLTGYSMEVIFSVDNIFVIHLIFCSLETPRRLTQKALWVTLLCSLAARPLLHTSVAPFLAGLRVVPYALGFWFIYCGTRLLVAQDREADVTQTAVVRGLRWLVGPRRFCEFYDEESEAVFVETKLDTGVSLLGVAMLCLFVASTVLSVDVALAKAEAVPNGYINFSSSAIALFSMRALFFVMRDVFQRHCFSSHGVGLALLFVGSEALMARFVRVTALASVAVVSLIVALSVATSCAWEHFMKEDKTHAGGRLLASRAGRPNEARS